MQIKDMYPGFTYTVVLIQEKSVSRYVDTTEIECIHKHFNSKDCNLFLGVNGIFYEFQKV
jgi:uncharacterized protein (DUF4213/DUF364 family)